MGEPDRKALYVAFLAENHAVGDANSTIDHLSVTISERSIRTIDNFVKSLGVLIPLRDTPWITSLGVLIPLRDTPWIKSWVLGATQCSKV